MVSLVTQMKEIHSIKIAGLNEEQIAIEKDKLLKKHIKKILSKLSRLDSFNNNSYKEICKKRFYFVQKDDFIVLCGVYNMTEKLDRVTSHSSLRQILFDYLLYSEQAGFFMVHGCSSRVAERDASLCTFPAIYIKNSEESDYEQLQYGETYEASEILSAKVKHSIETYVSMSDTLWNITIIENAKVVYTIHNATYFCELPLLPEYIIFSSKTYNKSSIFIPVYLTDYKQEHTIKIRTRNVGTSLSGYYTSLSYIMT